jgi:hypothetical protein
MPRILQLCKGCGEQKVLLDVGIQTAGIQQKAQMCLECFTAFMLTSISSGLVAIADKLDRKSIVSFAIYLKKKNSEGPGLLGFNLLIDDYLDSFFSDN